ncbi:sigma-70 family RNA polymerase sigma factor [Azohydromonas sp. G-1-1-14]|uniref:Sigma-70 family RNA polymerase sigma factor n=1 Tax=Azohydromonas caseinilytica TaxID=2728836 RepID=A0A848F815_9BURK|nr:sigma-70 family RNA polymerase sigma factor [Azohydromonas caseinilytica]
MLAAIPRLRRYARSLVFDGERADDLVQSTLERALTRWQQFDQGRDLLLWLLSIAHNAHHDQLRREARLSVLEPQRLEQELDRHAGAAEPDLGLRLDLLAALRLLTPELRSPLLLVVVEQLSYAETAQVLGIPPGTVMSRISRARQLLRRHLGDGTPPARSHLRRVI